MLRSLVGSEMCIRDSPQAEHMAQMADPGLAGCLAVIGRAAGYQPAHAVACLLYTSDAADDLLCVDLGGRRIIKKKTTQHNRHNAHG